MSSNTLEQHSLSVSHFGFSAQNVDELGATEYTLVTIAVDVSSSVGGFKKELENSLKEIINACRKSPRSDNLMVRIITFGSDISEMHGFKLLQECHPGDYDNCLSLGGMTALCDAAVNSIEALESYGRTLVDNDYDTNGILIVLTDGMENNSTNTMEQAKNVLSGVAKAESLESLITILIGVNVNDNEISRYLQNFNDEVGFTQYEEIEKADANTLAKLAQFVSQSISSQSQALGSGGPSTPIRTLEF